MDNQTGVKFSFRNYCGIDAENGTDDAVKRGIEIGNGAIDSILTQERENTVGVILKERSASVGTFQRGGMYVPPFAVGRHENLIPQSTVGNVRFLYRYGQGERSMRGRYGGAVSVLGAFVKTHRRVNHGHRMRCQGSIIGHIGTER